MKYAVMIEPFDEGFEYVCKTKNSTGMWPTWGEPKIFNTKEEAEIEASKWNTGVIVEHKGEDK